MGMYDTIVGAPENADDQIKCWDEPCLQLVAEGDTVPSLNGHLTYSVQYNLSDRFWHVENGVLVNVDAEHPQAGAPVFDKWGRELDPALATISEVLDDAIAATVRSSRATAFTTEEADFLLTAIIVAYNTIPVEEVHADNYSGETMRSALEKLRAKAGT